MKKNVCGLDKTVRIILGILIILIGIIFKTLWGLIGIIPLITGLIGFCPLWLLFRIDTCKLKKT
ncbi:MAG: DUF2892 domain-containing protein [candidate division WOR-3 bacterium]